MISPDEQVRIAIDYVRAVANGGIDPAYIADDFVAWSLSGGDMPRAIYLPRLAHVKAIFPASLAMTIDATTTQGARVVVQARSHGTLFTGALYTNDYVFLIDFNPAGQIRHAREYFHVEKLREILMPALLQWEAENV